MHVCAVAVTASQNLRVERVWSCSLLSHSRRTEQRVCLCANETQLLNLVPEELWISRGIIERHDSREPTWTAWYGSSFQYLQSCVTRRRNPSFVIEPRDCFACRRHEQFGNQLLPDWQVHLFRSTAPRCLERPLQQSGEI